MMIRAAEFQVHKLRVNEWTAPMGIDDGSLRFSWELLSLERGAQPSASRIVIATSADQLREEKSDVWDSGKRDGHSLHMAYDGPQLTSHSRYWWKVIVWDTGGNAYEAVPVFFDTGLYLGDWKAQWIWRSQEVVTNDFAYFRKEITVNKSIVSAKMFASAHHIMQIFCGGVRMGGAGSPAPTNPNKRKYYLAYDMTSTLQQGKNCIAAIVHYLGGGGQNYVNGLPGFRMQLEVAYTDGTSETFMTDTTWEVLKEIPHRIGTPYQQNRRISAIEDYDARKLDAAWMEIGYEKDKCKAAEASLIVADEWPMKWQKIPEGAVEEVIDPVVVYADSEDRESGRRQVFDTGKIVSGWPKLAIAGIPGLTVRIRYSEDLDEDGYVKHYVCNETSEHYYDQYTMCGDEIEQWQPDLSYKAFRYLEVTGFPDLLVPGVNIWVISAHTNLAVEGYFHCSNEMLNQLAQSCIQTQKNNMLGQLVDCPHREQAQYLADSDLQAETILYNFDAYHILEKVISDFADSQFPDGTFPFVYPSNYEHPEFNFLQIPEWDLHFCTILWKTYMIYGDIRLLERHYEPAKRMTNYYTSIIDPETGLVPLDKGWHISDWPYPTVDHSSEYLTVQNIKLYQALQIIAEMASRLDQTLDQTIYSQQADQLKTTIVEQLYNREQKRFCDCLGSEKTHQGVNAIALYVGLVPEADREEVIRFIAMEPWESRTVLSLPLLRVLFENGRQEEAYRLISKEEYPGWGYMIKQGATTMWEGWDDIESHCHAWNGYPLRLLQEYVVGIQPFAQGFTDVQIKPYMPADLEFAEASVPTVLGPVRASWNRLLGSSGIRLIVSIPPGMNARIILDIKEANSNLCIQESRGKVWENGHFISGAAGVDRCEYNPRGFEILLASGEYVLQWE
ncbi:Bacterial alpha-L-rhamnosidase [compost metagenome]